MLLFRANYPSCLYAYFMCTPKAPVDGVDNGEGCQDNTQANNPWPIEKISRQLYQERDVGRDMFVGTIKFSWGHDLTLCWYYSSLLDKCVITFTSGHVLCVHFELTSDYTRSTNQHSHSIQALYTNIMSILKCNIFTYLYHYKTNTIHWP